MKQLAFLLLALIPTAANATLQAAVNVDGGALILACDQNACAGGAIPTLLDTNPAVGGLSTSPFVDGDIDVSFSVQTSLKSAGPGGLNTLSSAGTVIQNTGGVVHTILFTIGDTSYNGPTSQFTATGSGTWVDPSLPTEYNGTSITMEWWNDPANGQGAESPGDTPGNLVNLASNAPVDGISNQSFGGPLTAFNASGALLFPDPGLFSMTLDNTLVLGPGIRLESRGQAEAKPQLAVPGPMSLLLLGFGLPMMRLFRNRTHTEGAYAK